MREEMLLESALARPRSLNAYGKEDLCSLAVAYAVGIAQNHPFVDGNKRIAFLAAYLFLEANGLKFVAEVEDVPPCNGGNCLRTLLRDGVR